MSEHREGTLFYDTETGRYDIRFDLEALPETIPSAVSVFTIAEKPVAVHQGRLEICQLPVAA